MFTAKLLPKAITDREFKYLHSAVGVADFHTAKLAKEIDISKFIYYICIDMAEQFDIVTWLKRETGFDVPKGTLENKILARGLQNVTDYSELTQKDKDLLKADVIEYILLSPSQTASKSWSHGDQSRSIGSQITTYRDKLFDYMMRLYRKWNDPKAEDNEAMNGYAQWMI